MGKWNSPLARTGPCLYYTLGRGYLDFGDKKSTSLGLVQQHIHTILEKHVLRVREVARSKVEIFLGSLW